MKKLLLLLGATLLHSATFAAPKPKPAPAAVDSVALQKAAYAA